MFTLKFVLKIEIFNSVKFHSTKISFKLQAKFFAKLSACVYDRLKSVFTIWR